MVTVMEGVHVTVRAAYKVNDEAAIRKQELDKSPVTTSNGQFRQTTSRIWTIRLG
jgi:hypothetical protein